MATVSGSFSGLGRSIIGIFEQWLHEFRKWKVLD